MRTEEEIRKELDNCIHKERQVAIQQASPITFGGRVEGWTQALKWVLEGGSRK